MKKIKRALISLSDKNNLKDLGYGPTYVIKQQELSTTCQI